MLNNQQTLLIVDDSSANIDILKGILRDKYKIKASTSGKKALEIAQKIASIDLVLLDIMMPEMDGYEVCRQLKANPSTQHIPIIFITAMSAEEDETKGLELGAVDYITKPINPSITKARIKTHLALHHQNRVLEMLINERTAELQESRLAIIQQLGRAAEYKDNETGLHVIRMSHYSRLNAQDYAKNNHEWVNLVFNASSMHDIGKIGIADSILKKPGPLNQEEWEMMKEHPLIGATIIGNHTSELLAMAKTIALCHHEKWDGSGYPYGLQEEEIPLVARIVSIADVFDALTTDRPYKKAWSTSNAITYIKTNAAHHFDPKLIVHFENALPDILNIQKEFAEQKS